MDLEEMLSLFNKAKKETRRKELKRYYNYLLELQERVKEHLEKDRLIFTNKGLYHCDVYHPNMFESFYNGSETLYTITRYGVIELNKKIEKIKKQLERL